VLNVWDSPGVNNRWFSRTLAGSIQIILSQASADISDICNDFFCQGFQTTVELEFSLLIKIVRFLFWLNRQNHPPMLYTSVVRADGSILNGDWLVPPKSQNMANVPAIGPNAQVFLTQGVHHLRYSDGLVLHKLLP